MAERLGVSTASVSEMYVKLASRALVVHDRYRGATLTATGEAIALEIVRHHRILETYLVEALGYSWDEVHEEADKLEHAISEKLEARMWEALGRPSHDPHGDPIPALTGRLPSSRQVALHEAPAAVALRVTRISDRDPDKLRAVSALGIAPRTELTVVEPSRWEGPVAVRIGRGAPVPVALGLAREIFVETAR